MPVFRIYRSELVYHSAAARGAPVASFPGWSFEEPPAGEWPSRADSRGATRVVRPGSFAVYVSAPPLSRLTGMLPPPDSRPWSFADRALQTYWDPKGLDAEVVAACAAGRIRGFSHVTKEEALESQPSLFAGFDVVERPTDGPYKKPMRAIDSRHPLPSITPDNVESVLAELAADATLAADPRLKFAVLAMAAAVACCRSEAGPYIAACRLELAIGDVLDREVGAGKGGAA